MTVIVTVAASDHLKEVNVLNYANLTILVICLFVLLDISPQILKCVYPLSAESTQLVLSAQYFGCAQHME